MLSPYAIFRQPWLPAVILGVAISAGALPEPSWVQEQPEATGYLKLTAPRRVLLDAQVWESSQFPHTLSVVERNRDGYRYWGWYGLNGPRGIGLALSNDLVNWTKYPKNPLLFGVRWPTVLDRVDPDHPEVLYLAFDRYDMSGVSIELGISADGVHIYPVKTLVRAVKGQHNQNPNLFRDPVSSRYYLTYYRGNNKDQFDIVSRKADAIVDLDRAPEKVLLRSSSTIAAPTLLFVPPSRNAVGPISGVYYLATEVYPARYESEKGEWQVKVFAANAPDGDFKPVLGNPVMAGERACLFQHVFNGRFYGFDCHIEAKDKMDATRDKWVMEEVEAPLDDPRVASARESGLL
jgi:hypothetical protein